MMAGDLCKLASCVSGIQMALNLCLLCSPAQRREKGEEGERAFVTVESHKVSKSKSASFFPPLVRTYMEKYSFF